MERVIREVRWFLRPTPSSVLLYLLVTGLVIGLVARSIS
jgi:hypothetical protein